MRQISGWLKAYGPAFLIIGLFLLVWQLYVELGSVSSNVLPSPTRIFSALISSWEILWDNTVQTLYETFIGFGVAFVLGFLFAVLLDYSPLIKRGIYPLLIASQTVPLVAIAPLLIVWFGFDILPKIIIVWLVCFFPVTVGAVDGFAAVDPDTSRLFQAMGATRREIFWKLKVPSALPSLFSGIRIAITYSIGGAILGEYVGAEKGLGRLISLYSRSFSRSLVFAVVFITAILSLLLFIGVTLLQRRVMPWYFKMRGTGAGGRGNS